MSQVAHCQPEPKDVLIRQTVSDVVSFSHGQSQLAARLLQEDRAAVLAGTEDGQNPFFSPDGKWIGFTAGSRPRKVPVLGGAPVNLCGLKNSGAGGIRGAD